jgi:hypothetical protein
MSRAPVAAALASLALCACGSNPVPSAGQDINVSGTIDRSPIATCPSDEPCDPPPVATMLVFSRPGSPDVRVRVAPDGSFALHLDPGDYSIAAAPPVFQGELEPSNVRVPASGVVVLRLRVMRSAG